MLVDGLPAGRPATLVTAGQQLTLRAAQPRWASRGAGKLHAALEQLSVDPRGRACLDAGAAHGGFTDVLLRAGAARVLAVDVGYGQLDWRLRSDERVTVLDRTNVRALESMTLPWTPDLVVADLSFISLRLVLGALVAVASPTADHVLLVKPQFEVGRDRIGKGGVVRDPTAWDQALREVTAAAAGHGLGLVDAATSEVPGPAGNIEFFLHLHVDGRGGPAPLQRAVRRGRVLASGGRDGQRDGERDGDR